MTQKEVRITDEAIEVVINGIKFVREAKQNPAEHFKTVKTDGGNYYVIGDENWWACSRGRDVTLSADAARALYALMDKESPKELTAEYGRGGIIVKGLDGKELAWIGLTQ